MAASTRATNLRKVWQNFQSEIFIENTANTFKQRPLKRAAKLHKLCMSFRLENLRYSRGSLNSAKHLHKQQ